MNGPGVRPRKSAGEIKSNREMDERIRRLTDRLRSEGALAPDDLTTRRVDPMTKTYAEKPCRRCGKMFTPNAPAHVFCCPKPTASSNGADARREGIASEPRRAPTGPAKGSQEGKAAPSRQAPRPKSKPRSAPQPKAEGGGLASPIGFADSAERYVCALVDVFERLSTAEGITWEELVPIADRIERLVGLSD